MCRLRELLPYFDGYKSLRRSPCNNLQRLRRLTFHYFFTIFSRVFPFYCPLFFHYSFTIFVFFAYLQDTFSVRDCIRTKLIRTNPFFDNDRNNEAVRRQSDTAINNRFITDRDCFADFYRRKFIAAMCK